MILSPIKPSKSEKLQLKDEPHIYLKIEKNGGGVQILQKDFQPMPNYNYRMVRYLQAESELHRTQELYQDQKYQINPKVQFPDDQVIIKRLSNLYGLTNVPNFFDLNNQPTRLHTAQQYPHCIKELGLFDTLYYKRLFITQSWSQSGKYILTANVDGRFQIISVDDRIPVYKKTLEPVWGLRFENPWELILIKAWAKINGGYHRISKFAKAFQFIESFSNSTWKYYNLQKQAQQFLKHYSQNSRFRNGKIILKTKPQQPESKIISKNGFAPSSSCYQLLGLFNQSDQKTKKPRYIIAIRSSDQAKWVGQISFYKKGSQKFFQPGMNLQHDFFMTHTQLLSVFSSAYITSNRIQDYYTGYKILEIPRNHKKAVHIEFYLPGDGFFDFNFKQFQQNKIEAKEQQTMNRSSFEPQEKDKKAQRYLKTRYILVRDNDYQAVSIISCRESILGSHARDYNLPRFTTYQIQYLKGYNKGDAHFVKLQKGRYILRFKSQNVNIDAKYTLNWISSHRLNFQNAKLNQVQKVQLLQDSMVSIAHKFPHFNFSKQQKTQIITISNAFEQIGYGFVAIKCGKQCSRSIILEVDPKKLNLEGYRLKGRYKQFNNTDQKFCIKIEKGQHASVVFKLDPQAAKYIWPSQAFNIYKKQLKKSVIHNTEPSAMNQAGQSRLLQKQIK